MTTRREPLFRFYVRGNATGGGFEWQAATRGGLPVLCNRDELMAGSPVEAVLDADVPFPFEVLVPERTFSDLDGATDPGASATIPATPGEFAARWNAKSEEQRAFILRAIQYASERSTLCLLAHGGMKDELAYLRGQITMCRVNHGAARGIFPTEPPIESVTQHKQ